MAVQARGWDQGGEVVDELQRGEGQRGASVALWLRQTIKDPVFVDLFGICVPAPSPAGEEVALLG